MGVSMLTPASIVERLTELTGHHDNIPESVLLGAGYDGQRRVAYLQFYDPKSSRMYFYYDKSGHKPYFYTKTPPEELLGIRPRDDVIDIRVEKKADLLEDSRVLVSKIIVTDPLAVSGAGGRKGLRNLVDNAYEADITYYLNYIYDMGLHPGTFYRVVNGDITPVSFRSNGEMEASLEKALKESEPEFHEYIREWARVLSQPLVRVKRVAMDIEVYTEAVDRVPDPTKADQRVISVALVANDGRKKVFLLKRTDVEKGESKLPGDVDIGVYESESDMLLSVFNEMLEYPVIVTFNGDDFDLPYLYHRAVKLGIPREAVPISLGRNEAHARHGVHVDLYKTFTNKSIQGYAFGNRYSEHTLNAISEALLGEEKAELETPINEMPLLSLAYYNFTDARLTLKLTEFSNDLLVKLLLTIMRIAKMPLADVSRLSVSNWIKSLMVFEHRRRGALVPRREDLESKSFASSKAIIKGKKYRGGFVISPVPGVYFNVVTLDFASLYPSIIKVYNLSYETVRCSHEECRRDPRLRIPSTNHWRCGKRKGVTSLLIGSLRDVRVDYFKALSKRPGATQEEREFYSVISQALKVILNASYGVMGYENFALYCLPVAEATAAYGRWAIEQTLRKARDMNLRVIYGDTDSLFVESPDSNQIKEITEWAKRGLGIDLEIDKHFRYVAFSKRKKNYVGVLDDGKVEVKGLTGKKSNTPEYIKDVFYEVLGILSRVKSKDDFETAKDLIRRKIREAYLGIKNREVPVEKLAFKVMLSKPVNEYKDTTPQHVKAARLLQRSGKEVKPGDIITFVKTTGGLGVKPIGMARPEDIDTEKYIEYLRTTFEQLLDALGYSFDEVMGVASIEDFFTAFPQGGS